METFKKLLLELDTCEDAVEWAKDMPIEEVVEKCERGDWLLWLAKKINIDDRKLHLAKGYCAKTVIHLMKDQRSKDAVQAAIDYGNGKINKEELAAAASTSAAAAAAVATDTIDYADIAAAPADYADYAAAVTAVYTATATVGDDDAAVYATTTTIDYAAIVYAAGRKNFLKETADICRKYIGKEIIEKVNGLLSK